MSMSKLYPLDETLPETEPLARAQLREQVLAGLGAPAKQLPPKLFYDETGSQLFEQISKTEEYYLTRTETAIMRKHAREMAVECGAQVVLLEYGSGSSAKTRILLDRLLHPVAYVPIDISRTLLWRAANQIAQRYPHLRVVPVWADYTLSFELPPEIEFSNRRVGFFPGSTLGNFYPHEAMEFLHRVAHTVGKGGGMVIGVDLKKDSRVLHRAYNDAQGVTAKFNLNMLAHLNRLLGADFDLDQFQHRALYNEFAGRIEMYLDSLREQTAHLAGIEISFQKGESILTEVSYKYSLAEFAALANAAGFEIVRVWKDAREWFSVQYLVAR